MNQEILVQSDNYVIQKSFDPRTKSFFLESWGFFSDRSKLGEKGEYIKTIWGMGYKFEVES